ncbi:MAG: FtsX-like permease family protein [Cyclobacteriaceae bacterium]
MPSGHLERLLSFSLRIISKNKFYSWVIVSTFALGIGACTVAYSLFESILQSPLPFTEAERLILIKSMKDENEGNVSLLDLQSIKDGTTIFEDVAAYWPGVQYNLSGDEGKLPEEVPTTLCTSNLFEVLGVEMAFGEVWPHEYDRTVSYGTVMSDALWKRRYDESPNVVGGGLTLDTNPQYGMYGILPEDFKFPFEGELFRSIIIGPSQLTNRSYRNVIGVARLAEGASIAQAEEVLGKLSASLTEEFKANEGVVFQATAISEMYLGKISPYLKMIAVAVACVFMLVCVNVGSLLLSIAHQRNKEIAVRRLIGGKFSTIVTQYLTQNLILAIIGGVFGVLLSYWSLAAIEQTISQELPFWVSLEMNNDALGLAFLLTLFAGILTAIIPAIKSAGIGSKVLTSSSPSSLGFNQKLKDILVGIQLALGTCLIIVASAIMKDLLKLQNTTLGFEKEDVEVFEVAVPFDKYKYDFDAVNAFFTRSLNAFEQVPGVRSVAVTSNLPLAKEEDILPKSSISLEGQAPEEQLLNPKVNQQKVSPDYHQAMNIQLREGRTFSIEDQKSSLPVCIVSTDLAKKLWPEHQVLGKRLKIGPMTNNNSYLTVVGISENVKHSAIEDQAAYDLYIPLIQTVAFDAYFVVKTAGTIPDLENKIAAKMEIVDADQSVFGFSNMEKIVSRRLWKQRISGSIFSVFGVIAFMIALIGIYSVVNHSVTTQMKQLSVRRVLGATDKQIALLMLRKIFILSIVGAVSGLLLTILLRDSIAQIIHDISLKEHMTSLLFVGAFITVSLLASVIPVKKVIRVNPANILRSE